MHTFTTFSAILGLLMLSRSSAASPRRAKQLEVFVPRVYYPHAGTVWHKGETHNVSWDVTHAPMNITNHVGRVYLRKGNLTTPLILADGFDVRKGHVDITVPWVVPAKDYTVVFFGDSGDFSQKFAIKF